MSRFTAAAMSCVLMFASPCLAHDPAGHAQHHDAFYKSLKQPGTNVSCCNDRDCRPAPHRVTPNGVQFFIAGKWFTPPAEKLIETDESPTGHWCGVGENYSEPITFCAIVPRGGV